MRRQIMSIINITPDSFFEGSRNVSQDESVEREQIAKRVRKAIDEGASIVDIGGYSSRPGAAEVSLDEEWRRVDIGVEVARELSSDILISIDTFRAEVVRRAYEKYGYFIVNDIMAGEGDPSMFETVAKLGLPYIAMHMRGTPATMTSLTDYEEGVVDGVIGYFRERVQTMQEAGIKEIILDPGFGFAKSVEQNFQLLGSLSSLCEMGYPVLAGLSRKSMIYRVLEIEPKDALTGTIALQWEALRQGASILRVHDTREASQTLRLYETYINAKKE